MRPKISFEASRPPFHAFYEQPPSPSIFEIVRMAETPHKQDRYVGPNVAAEYKRLDLPHRLNKYALNGKLIQVPLRHDFLSEPSSAAEDKTAAPLSILDSATANGTFILDLAESLLPTILLHGADLRPQHFPPAPSWPRNVSFFAQDILQPWPQRCRAAYDLVHQRNVLANIPPARVSAALNELWECVKPRGWLQLVDGDIADILDDPSRPAMRRFRDILSGLGTNQSPGPSLLG